MLKFYSLLIGENYAYTKNFQPSSKRKVSLYATCLMIPVILWFINGYLLVSHVLEGGVPCALLAAVVAALIIFLIERAIIMSDGGRLIFAFRITLGVVVAFLGSISLDEVIFKHDIDNQVAIYKKAKIETAGNATEADYKSKIATMESIVAGKYNDWKKMLSLADKEMKGQPGGSGQVGVGKIAQENIRMAALLETDYKAENVKLSNLKANANNVKAINEVKAEADFNGNALLMRIRGMVDLIKADGVMCFIYMLFTFFLFMIEFLVIIIKRSSRNSIDEDIEIAREKLIRMKTQRTLERSAIYYEPSQFHSEVINANRVIQKSAPFIFNN